MKVIIDTDAGVDDAQAILILLHKSYSVEIVAITTTRGNVGVNQVCRNVLRLLKEANRLDVPVYKGSERSLIGEPAQSSSKYHGQDGFGDVLDPEAPDLSLVQNENAIQAMIRIVNNQPGEITLICLAPLTNVAVALKLEPNFGKKLKECVIMGGNYQGKGNATESAEFNFHSDPEAAHVVLHQLQCPTILVTWELSVDYSLPWDWYEKFVNLDAPLARFVKIIEEKTIKNYYMNGIKTDYITCDQIASAIAVNKSVIRAGHQVYCSVELHGFQTRGQVVVDWMKKSGKTQNVFIVTQIDTELYKDILTSSVS